MTTNVKCPHIKKNGIQCGKWCVPGYNRCEDHGGPSPKKNFYGRGTMTTGASSSFPITRLAAKYKQMMTDGRVLSNRQGIDVIDTRIKQLLERVDVEDAPDRMAKLIELWNEYTEALDGKRIVDAIVARDKLNKEFEKAYHDYKAWEQIFVALDQRRKSVESEVKVLTAIKAIITAEDAYDLSAKMLAAVMRVIDDDPQKMKRIQYEFARLIGEVSDHVAERLVEDDGGGGGEGGGSEGPGDVDQEELLHPGNQE